MVTTVRGKYAESRHELPRRTTVSGKIEGKVTVSQCDNQERTINVIIK